MKSINSKLIAGLLGLSLVLVFALPTGKADGDKGKQPASKVTARTSRLRLLVETRGTGEWVPLLCNNIKTSKDKDLFISASLEAGLYTRTRTVGSIDESEARANLEVRIKLDGEEVDPGEVIFANRIQTLIPGLTDAETLEFVQHTVCANSFQWVAVDVGEGVHTICVEARVTTGGHAAFSAAGAVGKGAMTVETVRLIKDEDVLVELAP